MAETFDTRYVYAVGCTWHAPIQVAGSRASGSGHNMPCCPSCGSMLLEQPTAEDWWSSVRASAKNFPEYEDMMRWSEGKCFPDFDTLQNAYRQAKEE